VSNEIVELPGRPQHPVKPPDPGQQHPGLTAGQIDRVVEAASKMAGYLGEIAKDVVAIYRIRAEAGADLARADAAKRQIVTSARAEIDRLVQRENYTRTRGQVVVEIIKAVTAAMETIPEVDSASRHALIDSLRWLAEAAVRD
jgi:tryptophanase